MKEARKAVYICLYIWILAHPLDIPVTQDLTFTLDLLLTVALSAHVRARGLAGLTWMDDCQHSPPAQGTCPLHSTGRLDTEVQG